LGREFDDCRRHQAVRHHFDALDVAHARERASPRAVVAAWIVAGMAIGALAAMAIATPPIPPAKNIADVRTQPMHRPECGLGRL